MLPPCPRYQVKKFDTTAIFNFSEIWVLLFHTSISIPKPNAHHRFLDMGQIQNLRFATDGIWLTFSAILNFLLLGWTLWMGFQNERLRCFHNRQKQNCHSWTCCYSNTICKCDGQNRPFHFFRPLHFKDCVAIAMRLIVALFFSLSYWIRLIALLCSIFSV